MGLVISGVSIARWRTMGRGRQHVDVSRRLYAVQVALTRIEGSATTTLLVFLHRLERSLVYLDGAL